MPLFQINNSMISADQGLRLAHRFRRMVKVI